LEKTAWETNFDYKTNDGKLKLPEAWEIRTKISVKPTTFSVSEEKGTTFLSVKSDDSTGTAICKLDNADLKKTPILTWKWRAYKLPEKGDGRKREKDDQACGLYIGTGNMFNKKSISYRWDTDTPVGTEGEISYVMGSIKVKWITLKNKDSELKKWLIEKRNIAEDFKKAWGFIPTELYLSICGNSQHSGKEGHIDIDWIKLKSEPVKKTEKNNKNE
jgi:hypothetical protein